MLKIIQLSPTNLEDQPVEFKKVWTASAEGFLITTMSQNDNSDDGVIERKAKYYQETNLNLFLFYFLPLSMVTLNLVYFTCMITSII